MGDGFSIFNRSRRPEVQSHSANRVPRIIEQNRKFSNVNAIRLIEKAILQNFTGLGVEIKVELWIGEVVILKFFDQIALRIVEGNVKSF
ncbi:MAG: hypothetical protein F6J97_19345 [Leptolyngbya sp. SIO4C1]|nr:hypothetical protein [Leptolyngbya sp. SIO4C1]